MLQSVNISYRTLSGKREAVTVSGLPKCTKGTQKIQKSLPSRSLWKCLDMLRTRAVNECLSEHCWAVPTSPASGEYQIAYS